MPRKVKFKQWNCIVVKSKYIENDRIALVLKEEKTGEPVATASVNIVEYDMSEKSAKDHTFIKDWSENKGMLQALTEQGIVEPTGVVFPSGFVQAYMVKVLI